MSNYVIPTHGKVMACLDGSIYGDSVTDHAVWAAGRMAAPITFVHVLDRAAGVAPLAAPLVARRHPGHRFLPFAPSDRQRAPAKLSR